MVMSPLTLYLDDATHALVEQAAAARGVSESRWVADLIHKHAAHDWPQDCLAAAGQFPDFPLRQSEANTSADDVVRRALAYRNRPDDGPQAPSALSLAGDLVGCFDAGPTDLASNPQHLEGLGQR